MIYDDDGGRSVGIVRSRTQTKEFSFFYDDDKWDNEICILVRGGRHS
jgi:hypothetical protein